MVKNLQWKSLSMKLFDGGVLFAFFSGLGDLREQSNRKQQYSAHYSGLGEKTQLKIIVLEISFL